MNIKKKKRDGSDIAQLGERQTEDLKVPGSIPGVGTGQRPFFSVCRFRTRRGLA